MERRSGVKGRGIMRKEEGAEKKRGGCRNTKGLEKRRIKKRGSDTFSRGGNIFSLLGRTRITHSQTHSLLQHDDNGKLKAIGPWLHPKYTRT